MSYRFSIWKSRSETVGARRPDETRCDMSDETAGQSSCGITSGSRTAMAATILTMDATRHKEQLFKSLFRSGTLVS